MNADGFSQPDPAPVEQDDPDVGLIAEGGSMLDYIDDSVDCRNCEHYGVCGIIAAVRPMLADWQAGDEDDEPPIDATDLAVICAMFSPVEE